MTNIIAIWLAIIIIGFFLLDHFVLRLDASMFAARFLIDLIVKMAVWR